jgi:hypothetical protein
MGNVNIWSSPKSVLDDAPQRLSACMGQERICKNETIDRNTLDFKPPEMLLEISRYVNQSTKFRPEKCDG